MRLKGMRSHQALKEDPGMAPRKVAKACGDWGGDGTRVRLRSDESLALRMGSGVANDFRGKPGKEVHKRVLKHFEKEMSLRVQGIVDLAMLKPIH